MKGMKGMKGVTWILRIGKIMATGLIGIGMRRLFKGWGTQGSKIKMIGYIGQGIRIKLASLMNSIFLWQQRKARRA